MVPERREPRSSVAQPGGKGRGRAAESGTDGSTDQDVAGVVHAGVDAREGHGCRPTPAGASAAPARLAHGREQKASADAECPEGNEVDDGIPTHRDSGTPSSVRCGRRRRCQLHRLVDDEGGHADGGDTGEGGAAPRWPPERGEPPGHEEPGLGEVGEGDSRLSGRSSHGVDSRATARRRCGRPASKRPQQPPPPPSAGGEPRRCEAPGESALRQARAGSGRSSGRHRLPAGRSATARRGSRSTPRVRPGLPVRRKRRARGRRTVRAPGRMTNRSGGSIRRASPSTPTSTGPPERTSNSAPPTRSTRRTADLPGTSSAASFSASPAPRTRSDTTPSRPLSSRLARDAPRRCESS